MNAIIGYSEMLLEESDELVRPELRPDLEKIRGAGKHLLSLINDILDLSKIEAGKMDVFVESFDVVTLLADVRATVQPLMAKNGNTFEVRCGPDLGTLRSDQTKVRQILFNLLSNAAKFTNTARLHSRRGEWPRDGGDQIEFKVSDTGIGMTPEQMSGLFEALQPSRCVDHPELWRNGARAGDHPALLPHARRRSNCRERHTARARLHGHSPGCLP